MQKDHGIMLILICIILIICYFSPDGPPRSGKFENFGNIPGWNPQGSYISNDTFNPSSQVEDWQVNKSLYEPGNYNSLNFSSTQSSFPYTNNLPERYNDDNIGLIKSDGVIVGGYLPQILRPFDSITANPSKDSNCTWPCYSDKKFQGWCSEENAINYHAMRPLIAPNQYINLLRKMFKGMIDKKGPFNKKQPQDNVYTAVFCTESKTSLMSWLMQKVAVQVSKMPEMQKNGPWKSEQFYDTDVQLYQYVLPDGTTYFKIIFNLFNPLRSVATMVYATVYIVNGNPSLVDIDLVNNESMDDYMAPKNGFGPINAHNINTAFESVGGGMDVIQPEPIGFPNSPKGVRMADDSWKKDPNEFDWLYQNTLEVQKFNKEGFYSNVPGDNIKIEGGVPESLKKVLRNPSNTCNEAQLMSCITPTYTGVLGVSAKAINSSINEKEIGNLGIQRTNNMVNYKVAPLNGEVHNTFDTPRLIYDVKKPISLRNVETPSGTIFI